MILQSELSMNQYLKIQLESTYIQLDLIANLTSVFLDNQQYFTLPNAPR